MNVTLWIVAGVLAVAFALAGVMKLSRSQEQLVSSGLGWAADFPVSTIRLIGAAELLGAIGLIMPPVVGVAEGLVPLAASGLAVVMVGAAVTHARRKEYPLIAVNLVLLASAVFVAVMRFGPEAF